MRLSLLVLPGLAASAAALWPFSGTALAPKTAPLPLTPFYWDDETEDDDGNPLPPRVPASSTLAAIVPKPTAAPVRVPVEPFTGLEYHIGALKVRPSELKREAVALLTLLLYLAACRAGSFYNKSRATAWFKAHQTLLHEEWAQLGLDSKLELVQDGGDRFIAFATGRRGATSCLITIQTAPNDLFKILYHALRAIIEFGYQSGADTVTLAFTLREPVGTPGAKFVFGVADKSLMRSFRAERWDVSTFSTIVDASDLPVLLPPSLVVMAEEEALESMTTKSVGLLDALNLNTDELAPFRSLLISDLPAERPEKPDSDKPDAPPAKLPTDKFEMILSLRLPSAGQESSTRRFVALAHNLVDVLYSRSKAFSPLPLHRLKKRRSDWPAEPALAATEQRVIRETPKEAELRKAREGKQFEELKLQSMSVRERGEYLEKERKRKAKEASQSKKKQTGN